MELTAWQIYLIASGSVFWTAGAVLLARRSRWTVLGIFGVLAVLVVAAPTVTLWQINAAHVRSLAVEGQKVQTLFDDTYTLGMKHYDGLDHIYRTDKLEVYLVTRCALTGSGEVDEDAGFEQSMLIGTTWLPLQTTGVQE